MYTFIRRGISKAAVIFDIEKAFNIIWRSDFLYKLRNLVFG